MAKRDKIGVFVLVLLFVIFCVVLLSVFKEPSAPARSPAESVIVKQRIVNLEKSEKSR